MANIQYVSGNILAAKEEYIVQQTCCTALRAHGLSATIAAQWPTINPYKGRRCFKNNWAILEDRPQPGSIKIYEETHDGQKVICLFGQYQHGKPGAYKDPLGITSTTPPDTFQDRFTYFKQGLVEIGKLNPTSIAFPYRIGCGLAGGNWDDYKGAIEEWAAAALPSTVNVVIYVL